MNNNSNVVDCLVNLVYTHVECKNFCRETWILYRFSSRSECRQNDGEFHVVNMAPKTKRIGRSLEILKYLVSSYLK